MEFWRILLNVYHMHILPRINQALCRCAALEKLPAAREMTGVSIDGYAGWIGPRSGRTLILLALSADRSGTSRSPYRDHLVPSTASRYIVCDSAVFLAQSRYSHSAVTLSLSIMMPSATICLPRVAITDVQISIRCSKSGTVKLTDLVPNQRVGKSLRSRGEITYSN